MKNELLRSIVKEQNFFYFAALLVLIWWVSPGWATYERPLILAGQWWRLLTGQYFHWELAHIAGNLFGLAVAWLLFARHWRGIRFWWVSLVCVLGSSLGMFVFSPEVINYVGFSGALYGLIGFGALCDALQGIRFGVGILIGLVLKVSYEYIFGPVTFFGLFNSGASELAVQAHFFGVLTGLIIGLVVLYKSRSHRYGH